MDRCVTFPHVENAGSGEVFSLMPDAKGILLSNKDSTRQTERGGLSSGPDIDFVSASDLVRKGFDRKEIAVPNAMEQSQ